MDFGATVPYFGFRCFTHTHIYSWPHHTAPLFMWLGRKMDVQSNGNSSSSRLCRCRVWCSKHTYILYIIEYICVCECVQHNIFYIHRMVVHSHKNTGYSCSNKFSLVAICTLYIFLYTWGFDECMRMVCTTKSNGINILWKDDPSSVLLSIWALKNYIQRTTHIHYTVHIPSNRFLFQTENFLFFKSFYILTHTCIIKCV